jgi:hypothetical protein
MVELLTIWFTETDFGYWHANFSLDKILEIFDTSLHTNIVYESRKTT